MRPEETRPDDDATPTSAIVGIGCLTAFAGMFGGGMIAVLIGKIAGSMYNCKPMEGTPACHWTTYAAVGMLAGAIILPTISIMRLKRRRS